MSAIMLSEVPADVYLRLTALAEANRTTVEEEAIRVLTNAVTGDAPGWFESHVINVPREASGKVIRLVPGGERLPSGPIITGDAPGDQP